MTELNTEVSSGNWAMMVSEDGFGQIVQGISEVNQTIGLILSTQKGTDPFRPNFGSDIFEHISKPIDVAAANMTRDIIDAVTRWEPRVDVISVSYVEQPQQGADQNIPAGLIFSITWAFKGTSDQLFLNLLIGTDQNSNNIIRILGTESGAAVTTESNNVIPV